MSKLYDHIPVINCKINRKSEWCQERYFLSEIVQVISNRDGTPSAFIFDDFIFEGKKGRRIVNSRSITISDAMIVKIQWRFQKNGNNGETLTYMSNDTLPNRCPV